MKMKMAITRPTIRYVINFRRILFAFSSSLFVRFFVLLGLMGANKICFKRSEEMVKGRLFIHFYDKTSFSIEDNLWLEKESFLLSLFSFHYRIRCSNASNIEINLISSPKCCRMMANKSKSYSKGRFSQNDFQNLN